MSANGNAKACQRRRCGSCTKLTALVAISRHPVRIRKPSPPPIRPAGTEPPSGAHPLVCGPIAYVLAPLTACLPSCLSVCSPHICLLAHPLRGKPLFHVKMYQISEKKCVNIRETCKTSKTRCKTITETCKTSKTTDFKEKNSPL